MSEFGYLLICVFCILPHCLPLNCVVIYCAQKSKLKTIFGDSLLLYYGMLVKQTVDCTLKFFKSKK
jgi:hypothetical protein